MGTRTTTRIMTKMEKTRTARTTTRTERTRMTKIMIRTTTRITIKTAKTTTKIMTRTEKTRTTIRMTTKMMTRNRRPVVDLTFSAISSAENDEKPTSLITVSKTNIIAYILLYAFLRLDLTLKYSQTISVKNLMITL